MPTRSVVVRAAFRPSWRPPGKAALSFSAFAATNARRCPLITAGFKSASWRSTSACHKSFGAEGNSSNRDYPVAMAAIVFIAFVFIVVNFLVDMTYSLIDPRVRFE